MVASMRIVAVTVCLLHGATFCLTASLGTKSNPPQEAIQVPTPVLTATLRTSNLPQEAIQAPSPVTSDPSLEPNYPGSLTSLPSLTIKTPFLTASGKPPSEDESANEKRMERQAAPAGNEPSGTTVVSDTNIYDKVDDKDPTTTTESSMGKPSTDVGVMVSSTTEVGVMVSSTTEAHPVVAAPISPSSPTDSDEESSEEDSAEAALGELAEALGVMELLLELSDDTPNGQRYVNTSTVASTPASDSDESGEESDDFERKERAGEMDKPTLINQKPLTATLKIKAEERVPTTGSLDTTLIKEVTEPIGEVLIINVPARIEGTVTTKVVSDDIGEKLLDEVLPKEIVTGKIIPIKDFGSVKSSPFVNDEPQNVAAASVNPTGINTPIQIEGIDETKFIDTSFKTMDGQRKVIVPVVPELINVPL